MFIPMIANMSPVTEFINNLIGIIENINLLFNVIELHLAFGAEEAELHGYPKLKTTLTSIQLQGCFFFFTLTHRHASELLLSFFFTKSFSFCVGFCYQNGILMGKNCKHVTFLVLVDLSSVFDTVDHKILLVRLKSSIGINGTALNWFTTYLNNGSHESR